MLEFLITGLFLTVLTQKVWKPPPHVCDNGGDWQVTQLSDGKTCYVCYFPSPTLRNCEAQGGFQARWIRAGKWGYSPAV